MRQRKFILFFLMGLTFDQGAHSEKCQLGASLKELDSVSQNSAKREGLLREIVQDPLFARDDEKRISAQLELLNFSNSRKWAEKQLSEFVEASKPIPKENLARERRASALSLILKESKNRNYLSQFDKRIKESLLTEMPDTVVAKALNPDRLSSAMWVKRLEALSERNENQLVLNEYEGRLESLKKDKMNSCRVRYLIGKALRKNRSYQDAIEKLDEVAKSCSGDEARDALFLLTRLAAIVPRLENMVYFDQFEKKYSSHSYYDDTLIFKSSALDSMGKKEEAKSTLRKITELEGQSDMRFEAFFRLAFLHALEGKTEEAVRILRESLSHKDMSQMSLAESHRAMYWSARLQIFKDIHKQDPKAQLEKFPEATSVLNSLVESKHTSVYSWLSSGITKKKIARKALENVGNKDSLVTDSTPLFDAIYCLVLDGRKADAQRLIENLSPYEIDVQNRIGIAKRLYELEMYADSFRFAAASSSIASDDFRNLLFPKPYEEIVESAVKEIAIPKNLLFGLMREESRFDARVVSWAGAKGLLQLMPEVAKSEAKKIGIRDISDEEMFNPKTNISLAVEHLRDMKAELKHPLLVVAAYNAGLARVKKWREAYGNNTALDTFIENIPLPETRNYVKRVAGSWINYSQIYLDNDPFFADFEASSRL